MATFRSNAGVGLVLLSLACSSHSAQEKIARDRIEHVVPKRDFVGPMPARFEWTAAAGVEAYVMTIENEVDVLQFNARLRGTSFDWPKDNNLEPGTYFWRVVGVGADGRTVADSGRAAFVVTE
jgi:hypothetical protein